jgi:hypothetical protein
MNSIPVYDAVQAMGAFIPGEIWMAITLQLLAGGSYFLDRGVYYGFHLVSLYNIFEECSGWILETFHFPFIHDGNWSQLKLITDQFSVKTGGII